VSCRLAAAAPFDRASAATHVLTTREHKRLFEVLWKDFNEGRRAHRYVQLKQPVVRTRALSPAGADPPVLIPSCVGAGLGPPSIYMGRLYLCIDGPLRGPQ